MDKNIMRKKAYSKPCVGLVDFSLTGSIAGACVHEGNHSNGNTCGYMENGYFVFSPYNGSCDFPVDKEFCYHVPTADTSIFSS